MERKTDVGTIVRTAALFFALLNQGLVAFGYSPLPFTDGDVELFVSTLFTVITAVVAWWNDNNVTRKARRDKAMLEQMKKRGRNPL